MKHVKLFEQFINEAENNKIIYARLLSNNSLKDETANNFMGGRLFQDSRGPDHGALPSDVYYLSNGILLYGKGLTVGSVINIDNSAHGTKNNSIMNNLKVIDSVGNWHANVTSMVKANKSKYPITGKVWPEVYIMTKNGSYSSDFLVEL